MAHNPSKLHDESFYNELVSYIEVGNYVDTACAAMGVTKQAYYQWLKIGHQVEMLIEGHPKEAQIKEILTNKQIPDVPDVNMSAYQCVCWRFTQDVQRASARSEAFAVAMVRKHMPDQWTAAMTFLERRFPGKWKRRDQLDIGDQASQAGIDETLVLNDPEAVTIMHDVLQRLSKGQPIAELEVAVIDAEVVEVDSVDVTGRGDDEKSPRRA